MHDNDPKHTSDLIKDWLKKNNIQTLAWPPYSPDVHSIENLWDELERRLKKHQSKNKQEWQEIELHVIEKLIDSAYQIVCYNILK